MTLEVVVRERETLEVVVRERGGGQGGRALPLGLWPSPPLSYYYL
jgi:hypothetical protein